MTALISGRRLFEAAVSEDDRRVSASSDQGAYPPSDRRASASFEFTREGEEKDSSPVSPSKTTAALAQTEEEETPNLELEEARSTARPEPEPAPDSTTESPEQPTLTNGCPTDDEPEIRAEPHRAEQPVAPVVEFSFGRLVRAYPHPAGGHGVEHPAYRPHARAVWSKLTAPQKQDATRAAPNAPGKEWLGHWLDSGRETGRFEIVEQRADVPRVWVRTDTPQWAAWDHYHRAEGRRSPTTQHRVDGKLQTGWMHASEWPPSLENVERVGGVQ